MNATGVTNQSLICHGLKFIHYERTSAVLATAIGTCVVNFVSGILASTSNAVILAVISYKQTLKTPSNLLLCSMCCTDFLVGLIVQIFYVILRIHEIFDVHLCLMKQIYAFTGYLCAGASLMTLNMVTLDRWFAITKPYRYNPDELYTKYAIAILTVWIGWFSYSILPWVGVITPKVYYMSLSCVMLFSLITPAVCYINIYKVVRGHEKRITAQRNCLQLKPAETSTSSCKDRREQEIATKLEQRRSKTVAIIVAVFMVCYLPKVFIMAANLAIGDSRLVLFVCGKWAETLVFVNSSLNPLIYCLRITKIRNEVRRFARAKICRRGLVSPTGVI